MLCTVLHTPQHSSGDCSSIYLNPCDDSVGHQIADNMMNVTIITFSVELCDPQQPCSCSISSDLSLNLHVLKFCTVSFYRLRQLHCIRKSPTGCKGDECGNAADRVVSDTCKYYHGLKTVLHDEFHCLNVHERIEYNLGVMVYRYLHDRAPRYLADHLIPASDAAPHCLHQRSANLNRLTVPCCWLSMHDC